MYKNNSGLIAKMKVSKYKEDLCLTEMLVRKSPLLFLYVADNIQSACGGSYLAHFFQNTPYT